MHELISTRLKKLLTCLQTFIFADSYELLIELIRREIKRLARHSEEPLLKRMLWLLKKFMIAVDIHVLLGYRSWSGAADSLYTFLHTFFEYLEQDDRIRILQNAFYLTLIARFGRVYLPDYAMRFLDVGFSFDAYYGDVPVLNRVGS